MPDHNEKNLGGKDDVIPALSTGLEVDIDEREIIKAEEVISTETKYTELEFARLRRKIDFVIMPVIMLVYGLQYVDKNALGSGVVFGLKTDTHLVGQQYPLLSVWFYMAYFVGQLPMQWVLQRVAIGKTMGVMVMAWGVAVICLGTCHDYLQLSMVRMLLGWLECVVTPGFLLIIASWYKRTESTLRASFLFAQNTFFAVVFGVIIYFLARNSQEHGGPHGWRVINYFLGSITVVAGILVFVFVGTPGEVFWLTAEQKKMAHSRIVANGTGGGERHPWRSEQIKECLHDPQYWFAILFNLMATIPNGALGPFTVLVFESFGFDNLQSILYGLPQNAIGCTVLIITGFTVHKIPRARFPAALLWNNVPMIIFLYVGLSDGGKWQKWAAFSFVTTFAVSTFMIWALIPLNTAGRTKKSFMSASIFAAYCAGNITGSQIFLSSDAPKYHHGLTACAIVMAANTINISAWWAYYLWANRKREAAFVASGMSMEERDHLNKLAGETDITDLQNPHFRYAC
ncbi:MAG: hypothetical protein TREMPRED_005860 [Tremellales sp. Tagirdzhanova-0007]|nr:MAG: hypothetical protein TREMPRED_005860 [Tremellales sp. Tagirdzhanova-0007]